jgi:hypothetical protein
MCERCQEISERFQEIRLDPVTLGKPGQASPWPTIPAQGYGNSLAQSGWQCPVCGQGCAPFLSVCPCSQRGILTSREQSATKA